MATSPGSILIVEDYEMDAKSHELALRKAGVVNPIAFVSDGESAIRYLLGEGKYADRAAFPPPGVVLLDLKLPAISGFEFLRWCRAQPQLRHLLIVILSGYSELSDVNHAYRLGANTFLAKPLAQAELLGLFKHYPEPWILSPTPPPTGAKA